MVGAVKLGIEDSSSKPVPNLLSELSDFRSKPIKEFILSSWASIFLTEAGELYSPGSNRAGQLGFGDFKNRRFPTLVKAFIGKEISSILKNQDSCNANTCFIALTKSGEVYTWGFQGVADTVSYPSKESDHSLVPTLVPLPMKIKEIFKGRTQFFGKAETVEVYSWGDNRHGQLGLGDATPKKEPSLVLLPKDMKIKLIKSGSDFSLALAECVKVYAWGNNQYGQLGLGDTIEKHSPAQIVFPEDKKITSLYVDDAASLAITF